MLLTLKVNQNCHFLHNHNRLFPLTRNVSNYSALLAYDWNTKKVTDKATNLLSVLLNHQNAAISNHLPSIGVLQSMFAYDELRTVIFFVFYVKKRLFKPVKQKKEKICFSY